MTPLPADLVTLLCDEAGEPADVRTVEALAALWLADNRSERTDDDFPWSALCVFELRNHLETAWAFARRALAEAENVWKIVMPAAGPCRNPDLDSRRSRLRAAMATGIDAGGLLPPR